MSGDMSACVCVNIGPVLVKPGPQTVIYIYIYIYVIYISGMPIFLYFRYFWPDPFSADPFPVFRFFLQPFRLSKVKIDNAQHRRIVPLIC